MGLEPASAAKQALLAIRELQAQLAALNEPVAIVGMGCRYPGAAGIAAFWKLLSQGLDAVGEVPPERWDAEALYDPDVSVPGKMTSRWGGFLRRLDEFDAAFFGITPREAPHVDPRQRLMLEIAWEALESAGIPPDSLAGTATGVFVATLTNDYDHLLFGDLRRAEGFSGAGTANSVVANRISYSLDLRGPSMALDTACSGSLIAIHLACESLRKGESTLALAGGVNLNLMPKSSVFFSKVGALSPTGRCRTFDASADGIVRSDGAGVIVLKLLSRALGDRDPIAAVIRGTAVNHDGRSNGIMAPNGEAQAAALREAYRRAGIAPSAVQYVEAHGTGTRLGDPIEVRALGEVLGAGREPGRRCRLGSAKTNIGHSEAAAGVAGVIKTALALKHRQIPPSLHFHEPNPLIPFADLPFDVPTELGPWPHPESPLVAGISAFGFGGANAHVVLEEAPARTSAAAPEAPYILPVSARSPEALAELAVEHGKALASAKDVGGLCYTAAARRSHHPYRIAVTGSSADELRERLERKTPATAPARRPRTAFVFSGQGTHWRGMGSQLRRREPVFREALEQCARVFLELTGWNPIDEIGGERLDDTRIAQPAIFSMQVALAALWTSWGVVPDVVTGHSLGEAAAAYVAGALSLEDAARVVFHRSRLMKTVEGKGRTAVVGAPLERARRIVAERGDGLAVAGSNGPDVSVVSGDRTRLEALLSELEAQGMFCRMIPGVEIAFHSPHMDPLLPELTRALSDIAPRPARIPIVSTVTGEEIAGETLSGAYWARNLREPFLFTKVTERLLADECGALVEVSPHAALASAMTQTVRRAGANNTAVIGSLRRGEDEAGTMLAGLAALYELGHEPAWRAVYPSGTCTELPDYPWQRRRYWFDQLAGGGEERERPGTHPLLGDSCEPALAADPTRVWETTLGARRLPYLAGHKVWGGVVLPGAACLEMALAAAREMWPGDAVAVRDIVFESPLQLDRDEPRRVQTALVRHGAEAEFSLFSRDGSQPWQRHASGKAGPESGAALRTPEPFAGAWPDELEVSVDGHYAEAASRGLDYGPEFRGITKLWRRGGEALGRIALPSALRDRRYSVHPAALDAAIQVVAAAAAGGNAAYLPAGVRRWRVIEAADSFWCRASLRGEPGAARLEADLDLFAEDGRLVAQLDGLALARVSSATPLWNALIEERWEPLAAAGGAAANARWAIRGDAEGLAEALAEHGQTVCSGLDAAVTDVVHLGGIAIHPIGAKGGPTPTGGASRQACRGGCRADFSKAETTLGPAGAAARATGAPEIDLILAPMEVRPTAGIESALETAQAVLRGAPLARLWLVTDGSLEQAPVEGFALALGLEHPELRVTLVRLESGAGAHELVEELLGNGDEPRVTWSGGKRLVARIRRAAPPGSDAALRPDATYLITGGLGALGSASARLLVELGARHLVLTGRTARPFEIEGAEVQVIPADISDPADAGRLFEQLRAMPPLAGVIHAAGLLDDGLTEQQTAERFRHVMAPKALGAWNLHERTAGMDLDFFVLYSSAASLLGSAGQGSYAAANAYLDALADYRRSLGLPALSVNWGAWEGSGMAGDAVRGRMAARGVKAIETSAGLRLLAQLLHSSGADLQVCAGPPGPAGVPEHPIHPESRPRTGRSAPLGDLPAARIGVVPVDWPAFLQQLPPLQRKRFEAFETQGAAPRQAFRERLSAAPEAERPALLAGFAGDTLAAVLGVRDRARISRQQRFFELGMDSLMALELRQRLEAELAIQLPATLAFDYPSLEALERCLAKMLLGEEPGRAAAPDLDALSEDEIARLLAEELKEGANAR